MNIIQTTSALAPEFGGPVRTIPALSYELAERDNKVTLVYLDFGEPFSVVRLPSHPNLKYKILKVKFRIGMRPLIIPEYSSVIMDLVSGKDEVIFHDNGIWLPYSSLILDAAAKIGGKVITTTHGMLEPWAMNYGRNRKIASWHLYQKRRLERNAILHATSEDEAKNLRALSLTSPITVIPNGTIFPGMMEKRTAKSKKKTILFLSRIHPKKGLLNLVKAIDQLKPTGWEVVIAGYDEAGYQKTVENAVKDAGVGEYFRFIGPVGDEEKWNLYQSADLFVLPSFSENFGMVIAEALAAGLPVITTCGTPWKDLIDYNCGWWEEPGVSGLTASLKEAFSMNDQVRKEMGQNGRRLIEKKYSWPAIAREMNEVYLWMLGKRKDPPVTISGILD